MKKKDLRKAANRILAAGILFTLAGAIYIAAVQQAYAVSGCFFICRIHGSAFRLKKEVVNADPPRSFGT